MIPIKEKSTTTTPLGYSVIISLPSNVTLPVTRDDVIFSGKTKDSITDSLIILLKKCISLGTLLPLEYAIDTYIDYTSNGDNKIVFSKFREKMYDTLFKKKYILIDIHFMKRSKLIYMLKYTSWIIINNYLKVDTIYKNYFKVYDYITFTNYINNINNIISLLLVNIINTSMHKALFLILYISNIINNNNLINLFTNFYLLFILSNLYEVIKGKFNNNIVINDSLINKNIIIKKYDEKINNHNEENNNQNNEFKYFLEESMIIIN
jgi:hypothetical protein